MPTQLLPRVLLVPVPRPLRRILSLWISAVSCTTVGGRKARRLFGSCGVSVTVFRDVSSEINWNGRPIVLRCAESRWNLFLLMEREWWIGGGGSRRSGRRWAGGARTRRSARFRSSSWQVFVVGFRHPQSLQRPNFRCLNFFGLGLGLRRARRRALMGLVLQSSESSPGAHYGLY